MVRVWWLRRRLLFRGKRLLFPRSGSCLVSQQEGVLLSCFHKVLPKSSRNKLLVLFELVFSRIVGRAPGGIGGAKKSGAGPGK